MSDLTDLESELGKILSNWHPAKRGRLFKAVASLLRKSTQSRLTVQKDADGKAFKPRKKSTFRRSGKGTLTANRKVLTGFKNYIKAQSDTDRAEIGIFGKWANRASLHNTGAILSRTSKTGQKTRITLPRRQFVGLSNADKTKVLELLVKAVTPQ